MQLEGPAGNGLCLGLARGNQGCNLMKGCCKWAGVRPEHVVDVEKIRGLLAGRHAT